MVEGGAERPAPEEVRPQRVPPPDARPSARFPLPADRSESFDMPTPRPVPAPEPTATPTGDTTGSLQLPHWTEPPTGEVPQLGGEVAELSDDDDDDLWSGVSEPRFRSDVGDYAGSGFGDDPLHDDTTALGALVDMPEIDDEEEFAAEVAARRAPGRRGRTRGARTAPPPRQRRATRSRGGRRVRRWGLRPGRRHGTDSEPAAPRDDHRRHHHAHRHRTDPRGRRAARVRDRPCGHRRARHGHRRGGGDGALRRPAPRRVPARHPDRAARVTRDGRDRVQLRRARVPARRRDRARVHALLVPREGRARETHGERRRHPARVHLHRCARRVRGAPARVSRRHRHAHRPRHVRGRLRHRRLPRRLPHGSPRARPPRSHRTRPSRGSSRGWPHRSSRAR